MGKVSHSAITVKEADGSPNVTHVSTLVVSNGTLTDDGGGQVTLNTGGVSDHGGLTGLADDDHTQYALLAGRAGGQVLYGGNAANDDLTLEGTSHATRTSSYVLINPDGGNTGIGTQTPQDILHVHGGSGIRVSATQANQYLFRGFTTGAVDDNLGIALYAGATTSTPYLWIAVAGTENWGGPAGKLIIVSSRNGGTTRDLWLYANDSLVPSAPNIAVQANTNNVGIGVASPTAGLHLKAGAAPASSGPLKFTAGTNLATAEAGCMEYDGSALYFTPTGTTRKTVAFSEDVISGDMLMNAVFKNL